MRGTMSNGSYNYKSMQGVRYEKVFILCCEDVCPVGAIETFTFNPTACINCGSCMSACPEGAIYTGMRCVMDTDICSRCGICAVACPANCIVVDNKKK